MAHIKFTQAALAELKKRGLLSHPLLLIADDGGGKYSLAGGSCSIGASFSIIKLSKLDPDYPEVLENEAGVELYTSKYDLTLLEDNLVMDYVNGGLLLKNDSGLLDGAMRIGDGDRLLAANHAVQQTGVKNC
ncbi:MAG: iron-sulfur cluster biosynthesis family protein [Lactobacillus sp.]|jgi:hypothetical protein|nr:iron-sulfur cluster biosynthesis family protein [Lactobacillus sp.]